MDRVFQHGTLAVFQVVSILNGIPHVSKSAVYKHFQEYLH